VIARLKESNAPQGMIGPYELSLEKALKQIELIEERRQRALKALGKDSV
jgi:hypothetical protein